MRGKRDRKKAEKEKRAVRLFSRVALQVVALTEQIVKIDIRLKETLVLRILELSCKGEHFGLYFPMHPVTSEWDVRVQLEKVANVTKCK
jgi:hypothetical protein